MWFPPKSVKCIDSRNNFVKLQEIIFQMPNCEEINKFRKFDAYLPRFPFFQITTKQLSFFFICFQNQNQEIELLVYLNKLFYLSSNNKYKYHLQKQWSFDLVHRGCSPGFCRGTGRSTSSPLLSRLNRYQDSCWWIQNWLWTELFV